MGRRPEGGTPERWQTKGRLTMARRTFLNGKGISIRCLDPRTGQSVSFTVYTDDLDAVARAAHAGCRARWRATSLSDRRHKRRL